MPDNKFDAFIIKLERPGHPRFIGRNPRMSYDSLEDIILNGELIVDPIEASDLVEDLTVREEYPVYTLTLEITVDVISKD